MKINITTLLLLVFISLSVWLSFSVKTANENLHGAEARNMGMERELSIRKFQVDILQEALALNMSNPHMQILGHTPAHSGDAERMAILYLKAHACSPCNMPVIEGLIRAAANKPHFRIASHASNRHFLNPVLENTGLSDSNRVHWLSQKLYDYNQPVYDAELLFVDPKGFMLGVLPLELLKEKELFENLLQGWVE